MSADCDLSMKEPYGLHRNREKTHYYTVQTGFC